MSNRVPTELAQFELRRWDECGPHHPVEPRLIQSMRDLVDARAEIATLHARIAELEARQDVVAISDEIVNAALSTWHWRLTGAVKEREGWPQEELSAMRYALTAALAVVGDGWEPIGTCPDDGRDIIVFGGVHKEPVCVHADGGYWRYTAKDSAHACRIPTHWRPLPPAPKEG